MPWLSTRFAGGFGLAALVVAGSAFAADGRLYPSGPPNGVAMVFQSFALFPWLTVLQNVELGLEALGIDATELSARLLLRRDPTQQLPLRLDGEHLELLSITLDGQPLPATAYRYVNRVLEVDDVRDGSVLETRVRLRPALSSGPVT